MSELAEQIKDWFDFIDWNRFEDIDRAVNWELYHGTLPDNYWVEVEPLEHYDWDGFGIACSDLEDILAPLPHEMYWDKDFDCISDIDPRDDDRNWLEDLDLHGNLTYHYVGGDNWVKFNVREVLMHKESYNHVF